MGLPNHRKALNLLNYPIEQMSCSQAQNEMSLYMENEPSLTVDERKAFEDHLKDCPDCAQEYDQIREGILA